MIILDDALVHSDEERLAAMKRILFDAGTRHQILLFTCHPEAWRDLGVSARSNGWAAFLTISQLDLLGDAIPAVHLQRLGVGNSTKRGLAEVD